MKRTTAILLILMLLVCLPVHRAQSRVRRETVVLGTKLESDTTGKSARSLRSHEIIPKGEWQVGMTVAYYNLNTDNSELMLLINDAGVDGSLFRLAPNASYSYMRNQAVGLRVQYTNARCTIDSATLDLLGNFSFDVSDVRARMVSYGGYVYNRSYIGLDYRGRIGLFLDVAAGYTQSKTTVSQNAYTAKRKIAVTLSPGVVYFPMNNVSVFASLSLADISYNWSKGYKDGQLSGTSRNFAAKAGLNLMNLNFGLAVHL